MISDWEIDVTECLRGTGWVTAYNHGKFVAYNTNTGVVLEVPTDSPPYQVLYRLTELSFAARMQRTTHNCNHDFVNVGFTHITMVCKHCDQEQT